MEQLTAKDQATIEDIANIVKGLKQESKNKLLYIGLGMKIADEVKCERNVLAIK